MFTWNPNMTGYPEFLFAKADRFGMYVHVHVHLNAYIS